MKRCTTIWVLILTLILQIPAHAISPHTDFISPTLSFDGTKATCGIYVRASASTDEVSVILELRGEEGLVGYWTDISEGRSTIKKTVNVIQGNSYSLTATVRINGVLQASAPVSGTCKQRFFRD